MSAAAAAITAARHVHQWGEYAAKLFALKRGATELMFELVCKFEEKRAARAALAAGVAA